jgi:exodeoxyribonuclease X
MPPEASAVNHLVDKDLEDAPSWLEVLNVLQRAPQPDTIIAHKSEFERQFLNGVWPEASWVCTFKAALRVFPESPKFSNQVLRYWLGLEILNDPMRPPHRASFDVTITWGIFERLMEHASLEDMIRWEGEPAMHPRIWFGKYRNALWADVPGDYLKWVLKSDLENDVKWNSWNELHLRGEI